MDKKEFLNKIVFGWIKRDFERMLGEIKPIPHGEGNINFFLALCCLSTMEFLGGLLLGKHKEFEKNVKEYINRCFDNPVEYPIDILRDIFRNGLAHEFFPRAAVSRDNKHPAIFLDDKIGVVLDAETLVNDFLHSLDKFKTELDDGKYEKRISRMELDIKRFQNKHRILINNLPKREKDPGSVSELSPSEPPDSNPDSISASSSTASFSASPTISKSGGGSPFISLPPSEN